MGALTGTGNFGPVGDGLQTGSVAGLLGWLVLVCSRATLFVRLPPILRGTHDGRSLALWGSCGVPCVAPAPTETPQPA